MFIIIILVISIFIHTMQTNNSLFYYRYFILNVRFKSVRTQINILNKTTMFRYNRNRRSKCFNCIVYAISVNPERHISEICCECHIQMVNYYFTLSFELFPPSYGLDVRALFGRVQIMFSFFGYETRHRQEIKTIPQTCE